MTAPLHSDTTEHGLETLIVGWLVDHGGYHHGNPEDYDREHALDLAQLLAFLSETQPRVVERFHLTEAGPERLRFLARLEGEVARRGVVDVLRKGIKHGPEHSRKHAGHRSKALRQVVASAPASD